MEEIKAKQIENKDKIFEYHPSDDVLISFESFEGPIATLYNMIINNEKYGSEYNIKTFPLHLVTDQFVAYLNTLEKLDTEIASDFIKIASLLLKLKADALVRPEIIDVEEEEDDSFAEDELRRRLMIYDIVKSNVEKLKAREKLYRINRKPKYTDADAIIVIENFNLDNMVEAFGQVLLRIDEKDESIKIKRVQPDKYPLESQVKKVASLLQEKPKRGFFEFFGKNVSRSEVISTFEALLRMMSKQMITATQEGHSEMEIELKPDLIGKEIDFSSIISE
ncbi:MAG: segregation/condensation protein A [Christensenella sp.]|nr:segregation/condensation protein A [Christensenella sp.]